MDQQEQAAEVERHDAESDTALRVQRAAYLYNPDLDFRKLALEAAYFTKGFRLVEKEELIGVPFVVVNVTYREGFPRDGKNQPGDYVSVEAVVADAATLDAYPVKSMMKDRPVTVYPNEPVIFNDSGTGIRRELTRLLQEEAGVIDVGTVKEGNAFDKPLQKWASGADLAAAGISEVNGQPFRYVALRGLRRSDYESPYGPATTFYFG